MKTLKKENLAETMLTEMFPAELVSNNSVFSKIGKTAINVSVLINTFRPLLTIIIVMALSCLSAFAQGGNPFPTRGDQSLGNLVSGALTILTWLAAGVGIGSFAIIPVMMFFRKDWMGFLWSGLGGIGGWLIIGSLSYMLANNQDPNLPDLGM